MHGFGVAVLGILNQKHHEESDNGGAGVDDELPGIGEMKGRPGDSPDDNDDDSDSESPGRAENLRRVAGENAEGVAGSTNKVARFFCFRLVVI
jgi:hypothetical protein